MQVNFLAVFIASLIPLVIGFVWFNPKTFGTIWMNETGMTPEKGKEANMMKVMGLTWLFSFMLAFIMQPIVIHQYGIFSILGMQPDSSDPNSEPMQLFKKIMDLYGSSYRTFKHGAFHGIIAALFLVLPIMAINALFEQKSAKYVAVNLGYWAVSMALMGGIVSVMM